MTAKLPTVDVGHVRDVQRRKNRIEKKKKKKKEKKEEGEINVLLVAF